MAPLRISMVGLSQWESVFVQTSVDLASGIDIASWRFVSDPDTADVLLVDADHGDRGGRSFAGTNGKERPIVVSFSGEAQPSGRGLTRPVGYADLISCLKAIESELSAAAKAETSPAAADPPLPREAPEAPVPGPAAATTKDHGMPDPTIALQSAAAGKSESLADKSRPARRFIVGTRLIGLLNQIIDAVRPVELSHPEHPTVLVFPDYNAYSTEAETLAIPRMYRSSALSFQVRPVSTDLAAEALASDRCRPLGRLVYCATLFGSEGRLLLNTDPDDQLRLVNWPDFDAVPHLPEHKTVAKYMLVHTSGLAEIAASTGVHIDKVIDFCNACEAAGLIRRYSASGILEDRGKILDRMRGLFQN